MTTTAAIRDAIVDKVTAISGIGKVHGYERYTAQQTKLKELFESNNRILGWVARRASFRKTQLGDAVFMLRSNWELHGYMSLDDASQTEIIFDALVDLVQATLSNDPTFGGIGNYVPDYEIKAELDPVMFCGVLCHSVKINFDSLHEETSSIDQLLNDFLTLNSQYDIPAFESAAEHAKWLANPANYSTSKPELIDTLKPQE